MLLCGEGARKERVPMASVLGEVGPGIGDAEGVRPWWAEATMVGLFKPECRVTRPRG